MAENQPSKPKRGRPRLVKAKQTTLLSFSAPPPVAEAVRRASESNYESPTAFIRRVVIERLRADGLLPSLGEQR